ncbi:aspartate--tRNA(Asn) ligase [Candidatus Woesebacteria bacterium RIFCSPHIGHO2_01_FULL_44_10]|uniref:Aspartate--tRNA ligase n=1 Tax=Candidatus Woesebacteria bacterium RIFCSPLOWO2_01_FULL_44_14 TaxID=1802525 RepID=A0A1F8C2Z1_9BACT|nr:MAG: aspartate--tRNA(Asn) ligase [Candidatus Woesebacteria bacterium RIFCSPHIGHO2_01_FULL_44_10]OGM54338.1 MAG: aspartate--tRNA(Asn) ligase [Candidatus Woesebacteria bacterium RIFCSPHIGHO2_12_FULL_44_11]OGM70239.1 MAG: aspartate--tRNA(Asn) ligase [Candidatus Woesebacteria bacterium RIFCSPLOWO2_01_FULL_44_14]
MDRTLAIETTKKVGEKVLLKGWVDSVRDHGGITFIDLRDRSGLVQCVGKGLPRVTPESVVEIAGEVKKRPEKLVNKNLETGVVEIQIKKLKILSLADELPIPIQAKEGEVGATKRFNWRWINLRQEGKRQIFEVWTALEKGFRDYWEQGGYVQVYSPSFMSTASESGAEVFEVKYFERKAFLAQSPQFYKQMAMAAGFEKIFMVGPVFRAELSFTTRHMTEFTGWDFEISFIESHYDVMAEEEKMLVSAFKRVKADVGVDLEIPQIPFPKISMAEAKNKLNKLGIESEKEYDVTPEEEKELSRLIKEETGHDFVFLIDYPKEARPFYHMRHKDNPDLTMSFDLLYKGIEITTGAQREHRIEVLEKQAKEKKMSLDDLKDYLNFFRYGCPPHGGGGIGPGRIVMKILDLPSVKEATFLPRDVKRLKP